MNLTVKSLLISKNERSLPITIKLMHYTFKPEHVHTSEVKKSEGKKDEGKNEGKKMRKKNQYQCYNQDQMSRI